MSKFTNEPPLVKPDPENDPPAGPDTAHSAAKGNTTSEPGQRTDPMGVNEAAISHEAQRNFEQDHPPGETYGERKARLGHDAAVDHESPYKPEKPTGTDPGTPLHKT